MRTSAFIFALAFAGWSHAAMAASLLVIDPITHDFGAIEEGPSVETSFTLKNEGDAPLSIIRVTSTCGCATSKLAKSDLAPQETTTLTVTYETTNRPGAFTRSVRLFTDEAHNPQHEISVTGKVKAPPHANAVLSPNPVRVGRIPVGLDRAVTFTLTNSGDSLLVVSRITLLDTFRRPVAEILGADPLKLKEGNDIPITVTINPERAESFRYFVEFETNNELRPIAFTTLYGEGVAREEE